MAIKTFPANARIRRIQWILERPAQVHRSAYTGKRVVVANPWYGRWTAKVELSPIIGESNVLAWRAFLASLRGAIHTFRLPAVEKAQNSNLGVTVTSTTAAGATSVPLTGITTPLTEGQLFTIKEQLLQVISVSGSTVTFEPPLRTQAAAGTPVVTGTPYALVSLANPASGWAVDAGQVYGIAFDVEEAIGSADTAFVPEQHPYAEYALALDFAAQSYWVAGAYTALGSVAGYSFTRSGTQGALDSSGVAAWFAANTPAINNRGFHSYQALTNVLLRSQEFDNASWTKINTVVTANGAVAPDGTTTADKIVDNATNSQHDVAQSISAGNSDEPIVSVFIKRESGTINAKLGGRFGGVYGARIYDPDNGAELGLWDGSPGNFGATHVGTVVCANGWYRHSAKVTNISDSFGPEFDLGLTPATGNISNETYSGSGTGVFAWQAQILKAGSVYMSYADGGPLIATTGSSASIGASVLNVSPPSDVSSDHDFYILVVGTVTDSVSKLMSVRNSAITQHFSINLTSAGGLAAASSDGWAPSSIHSFAAGRWAAILRRKGGKWSFGGKNPSNSVVLSPETTSTWSTTGVDRIDIGHYNGANQFDGQVERVLWKNETLSDAAMTALLTAA